MLRFQGIKISRRLESKFTKINIRFASENTAATTSNLIDSDETSQKPLAVSEISEMNIPTLLPLRPKSKIAFIQKRRDIENQRRMIATKVERDPIYHLTGGKFAQDAKAKATYEELMWKRIWTWTVYTGPFWIVLFIWYIYNNWEMPILGLSGKTDIKIEDELDSIALNRKYGEKMFQDELYRKIFKSECLKLYGLEQGVKIYNQAVDFVGYKEKKKKKQVVGDKNEAEKEKDV